MPTIYRNVKTQKLVLLALSTPMKVLGSHFEESDFYIGVTQKVKNGTINRVGTAIVINPRFYKPVAHV